MPQIIIGSHPSNGDLRLSIYYRRLSLTLAGVAEMVEIGGEPGLLTRPFRSPNPMDPSVWKAHDGPQLETVQTSMQLKYGPLEEQSDSGRLKARRLWPRHLAPMLLVASLGFALCGCATQHFETVEDYREQYDRTLISPGAQFAALPPAVQNTVRAEVGSANIAEIVKDTSLEPRVLYRVYFQNSELLTPLTIASDGSLLDPDLLVAIGAPKDHWSVQTGSGSSGSTINDLPSAAVKSIQRIAPDALIDTVVRQVSGNQVTYEVTFKDRAHPAVHVTADGTIQPGSVK